MGVYLPNRTIFRTTDFTSHTEETDAYFEQCASSALA